ncbi:MAG: TetR/AcrR family transcriptional regulator [Desulfobulbaceae bacterium]|nr:TetR/AcrR family transcriptional regulator [Desulfobulbaceae bacterium]
MCEYLLDYSLFIDYLFIMNPVNNTRQQIIKASWALFSQFGFKKTTVAEIAAECSMSPANIYRFFESKKDILAEIVSITFQQDQDILRGIARKTGPSATEKLENFILEMLSRTYQLGIEQSRLREACNVICEERFDLVRKHKEVKQSILAEILAEGNLNHEFNIRDIVATAYTILNATVLCQYPVFVTLYPRDELEEMARGIVKLLIHGLK